MSNVEKWLKDTKIPYAVIAKDLNVSTKTVYNWVEKVNSSKNLSHRAYTTLEKYIEERSKSDIHEMSRVQKQLENQERFIDLQNEKIEEQRDEIDQLKHSMYPIQNLAFRDIIADMESFVEMELFPPKRKIIKFDGKEKLSQRLGVDVSPYLDLGVMHEHFAHPIEKIITEHTNSYIQDNMKVLPKMFDVMKKFLTEHYMTLPIVYTYKKRLVHTLCYCKINWQKPVVVHSKMLFMNGSNGPLTIDN